MKNSLIIALITFISTSIFSQIPKEAISPEDIEFENYLKQNKIPIVKGKIINFTKEEIPQIKITYTIVTLFGGNQVEKFTTINSEGNFELKLDYIVPYQQIWLTVGEHFYSGIYAHSELFIEIDWQKAKEKNIYMNGNGVKYLGKDGDLNTYLNNYVLFEQANQKNTNDELSKIKHSDLSFTDFEIKYDSLYKILKEIDSDFINQNKSNYGWIIENERMSDYCSGFCEKHFMQNLTIEATHFTDLKNHKSYLASNSGMMYYRYLYFYINSIGHFRDSESEQLNILEEKLNSTSIKDTVLLKKNKTAVDDYLEEFISKENSGYFYAKLLKYLDSTFATNKADFMKLQEDENDLRKENKKTSLALASIKTNWIKDILNVKYQIGLQKINEIDNVLSQSKLAATNLSLGEFIEELTSGAKLYKIDSGKGLDLLAKLKTSFKDKAMLLDFWATWCGPCLAEFPESKKLHEETSNMPIEFVYLCSSRSSSIEKWKTKIVQHKLSGTHIFVEEKMESDLMDFFEADGFPSYRFIDTNGKYRPEAKLRGISVEDLKKLIEDK